MSNFCKHRAVLVECGTFNPPTLMHLRMFEIGRDYLRKKLNFATIEGIMSPVNNEYRKLTAKFVEDSSHRLRMCKMCLKNLYAKPNWVRVDDWESRQPGWNKTLDVLRHFSFEVNRGSKPEFKIPVYLLCGGDTLESFTVPGLWRDEDIDEVLRDYGIIVIMREGSNPADIIVNSPKAPIFMKYKNNIHIIDDKIKNSVSSSIVRDNLSKGISVRYLIDDTVLEYIHEKNLYNIQQQQY